MSQSTTQRSSRIYGSILRFLSAILPKKKPEIQTYRKVLSGSIADTTYGTSDPSRKSR